MVFQRRGSAARPQRRLAPGSVRRADLGVRRTQRMRREVESAEEGAGPHLVNHWKSWFMLGKSSPAMAELFR